MTLISNYKAPKHQMEFAGILDDKYNEGPPDKYFGTLKKMLTAGTIIVSKY